MRNNEVTLRIGFTFGLALGVHLAFAAGSAGAAPDAALEDQPFFVRSWTVDDGTSDNTVVGALRRPDGYLWVAMPAGLFRFDGVKFDSSWPSSVDAQPGAVTPVMVSDRRGRLWRAKSNGTIVCVDGRATRVFTSKDGLPNSQPASMVEDAEESLLVSYGDEFRRIKNAKVQLRVLSSGSRTTAGACGRTRSANARRAAMAWPTCAAAWRISAGGAKSRTRRAPARRSR